MDVATRRLVRLRAGDRCEYCGLTQDDVPYARFHIEHIVPRQHGGSDDPANLALSCHHCNLHKGPNLTGIDPATGSICRLFNPRLDAWDNHFAWHGPVVIGTTPIGTVTIHVLAMNSPERVELRASLSRFKS